MLKMTENDLKEIFALFSSPTDYELTNMIYNPSQKLFYGNEDLNEEYSLTQDKKEFAEDSLRAILYYLVKHGFEIRKGNEILDMKFIKELFI
ncbi:MAG: hypothetical protein WC209_03915 [Ignavibacteriaceae bacterium]|jgi:hypothetical protein